MTVSPQHPAAVVRHRRSETGCLPSPTYAARKRKGHRMATVDTTLARARTHHKKGEFARARELCRDVLQRYPKNSKARALLSRLPESAPSQDLLEKLIAAHK